MTLSSGTRLGSVALLALVALLGLFLSRCGGGGPEHTITPGVGTYQRLELGHTGLAPQDEVSRTLSLEAPRTELGDWEVEGPEPGVIRRVRAGVDENGKPEFVTAVWLEGEKRKRLKVPGEYDPTTFNQVLLHVTVFGTKPELVRVGFHVQGRPVVQSQLLSVKSGGKKPTVIPFDFPQLRRLKKNLDELVVQFQGESKAACVTKIELVHIPNRMFQPPSEGLGELVTLQDEDRRAVGMSSKHPLQTRFGAPEHGELTFSFGLRNDLRVPGEKPQLVVTLTADGVEPVTRRLPMESGRSEKPRWRQTRFDLAAFANKEVTARFELEVKGDHEGFCLVGEAAVSRRGTIAPTVLLVTSDTHRADHMGQAGGDAPVDTPVLDALGARGVYFTDAYSATNVTNPSHVSLMTGMNPRDTRVLNNRSPLIGEATTVAERFREAGYRTFAVVSAYHLSEEESGLGQGFDRLSAPDGPERHGGASVDVLEEWTRDAAGQPLFVWLHLFDPHSPYEPPEPYDRKYYEGDDPYDPERAPDFPESVVPPYMEGLTDADYPYQQYRAEVDFVDLQMGRVFDIARYREGVVAFTADHGEAFGEHGVWWDHADLYPETVHIPLVLSWPGGPTGVRSDEPVSLVDVGRTLLNLSDLDDSKFPGRDLRWALAEFPESQPRFLLSAHRFTASLQSGRWLLILHMKNHQEPALATPRKAHQVELYDLDADPRCLANLVRVERHYDRAKKMRANLIAWLQDAPARGLGATKVMSARALESLDALGYGGGGSDEVGEGSMYAEDPGDEWCQFFSR